MLSRSFLLETCRGVKPSGCPHALSLPGAFTNALADIAATAPPPPALAETGRPIRHHERFRLSLCACPNGCARPHVADLGFVAAQPVAVSARTCSGCGSCLTACPDGAITLPQGTAVIDVERCLGCGVCANVCPQRAIDAGPVVLRAMLGGRLGRRPRLGVEAGTRFSPDAALALAGRCREAYMRRMRPGLRFADIVFPGNLPGLPAWALS
jgi:anaerobic sulfite reductase subunit C